MNKHLIIDLFHCFRNNLQGQPWCIFISKVSSLSPFWEITILSLITLMRGLIAKQVIRFSPDNKSVISLKPSVETDYRTSKSCQVGTRWEVFLSCPRTARIASCCSKILSTILVFEPHLVHTSPFSFFWGKPFCTRVCFKSLCLFQLLEKAATTFRHTDHARSILLSFKPLFMAKSKLWPKQFSRPHFNNWHA